MEYNANIQHVPPLAEERKNIPYVGNGYFGLEISADALLHLKYGRVIQLATQIQPIMSIMKQHPQESPVPLTDINESGSMGLEAVVTEYLTGMVWRLTFT